MMPSLHCLLPQSLCIHPSWPQLWQATVSRVPDPSELSPQVKMMCPLPSSLMVLCSHLPGLSCGEPVVHNHRIPKGLVLWFQYKVAVLCCPHLSAVINLATAVVRLGTLSTASCWALQSSFCAKFLWSVTQASVQ